MRMRAAECLASEAHTETLSRVRRNSVNAAPVPSHSRGSRFDERRLAQVTQASEAEFSAMRSSAPSASAATIRVASVGLSIATATIARSLCPSRRGPRSMLRLGVR
jgi:hypothetical protein